MTLQQTDLLLLARRCAERVAAMNENELDTWYEDNVGYRLLDDDPDRGITDQRDYVACAMFFHVLPEGMGTPGAERVCDLISKHITEGATL